MLQVHRRWQASATISLAFLLVLGIQWYHVDSSYKPNPGQLTDEATALEQARSLGGDKALLIPTGVYIESIRFQSGSDVYVTGYVWMRYAADVPKDVTRGFVLPDAVSTSPGLPAKAYQRTEDDGEVVGWYFESTLRQSFDYSRYPLDHKQVRVRIWHADFDRNVVLVPDLSAYDATKVGDTFGVAKSIVLGTYTIDESFFTYVRSEYGTDFGLDAFARRSGFPELRFEIVLHRNFYNSLLVDLVPLLVVAVLLFAGLLTLTSHEKQAATFGFSMSAVIGSCAALFFVVMLAHIHLRQQFPGAGVVYLEYFYLVMYVAILGVASATYVFSLEPERETGLIHKDDGLALKIAFWPLLLGIYVILSFAIL